MQLSLKHFILQAEVFSLYRFAIRASRHIPDPSARKDTVLWVRQEIERNKRVRDVDKIQNLVSTGRRELRQILPMRTYLHGYYVVFEAITRVQSEA